MDFALLLILVMATAFGFAMYHFNESPQRTFKRLFGQSAQTADVPPPASTGTPALTPLQAPAPAAIAMQTPSEAPAPTATPTPPDPIVWLVQHKDHWPKTVTLLRPEEFPVNVDGNAFGSAVMPAGTVVSFVRFENALAAVSYRGQTRDVPIGATNLPALAKQEMTKTAIIAPVDERSELAESSKGQIP